MSEFDEVSELIEDGLAALKGGDLVQARSLFTQAVLIDQDNERAWLGLAMALEDKQGKVSALEKVLQINPDNLEARELLDELVYRPAAGRASKGEDVESRRRRVGSIADRVFSRLSSMPIPQSDMSFLDRVYAVLGVEPSSEPEEDTPVEDTSEGESVIRPLKPKRDPDSGDDGEEDGSPLGRAIHHRDD